MMKFVCRRMCVDKGITVRHNLNTSVLKGPYRTIFLMVGAAVHATIFMVMRFECARARTDKGITARNNLNTGLLKGPCCTIFLIVGASTHAAIFMARDYDMTTQCNNLLDCVLRHRNAIISHLDWVCIFSGFYSFGCIFT
jgi:hypothetical protein